MKLLEQKIREEGRVYSDDILKVDSFLNHQLDVDFLDALGEEFHRLYKDCEVNKLLTIEPNAIGVAALTAHRFHCPLVFAKKKPISKPSSNSYTARVHSHTHSTHNVTVSHRYLAKGDRVLIIDDVLANGSALAALLELCEQAGATVVGAGIVIEKTYRKGGQALRDRGVRIESLARIKAMSPEKGVSFAD